MISSFEKSDTAANQPNDCLAVCSSDIYIENCHPKKKIQLWSGLLSAYMPTNDLALFVGHFSDQL